MYAFITGGRGFVGGHLRAHLEAAGDEVRVVDRECDVTVREEVADALGERPPDVIYHLAALTSVARSWQEPSEFTRVNVLGTLNVLQSAREVAPRASVIVVSSADVYGVVGESDLPLRESRPPAPANPYSQTKLEAEIFARDAARAGQRVIIARPFNHVGPGQSSEFVVPALAQRLLDARDQGLDEIAVGDLSPRRDFSDVRDVVRAYRLLELYGVAGEVYNVASGLDVAIGDVAARLVALITPTVTLVRDESLIRPVEVPVMRGSFEKLHDATGWEPTIALEQSLLDVIRDLEGRRNDR
ncbi:MAG TPA: GDP-mannose 4,6-dehydratase [Acidimicrobiales bacterium]|nr:GDP-mannose 4,6-dehydratase [Acidimicrobiales bacterium]